MRIYTTHFKNHYRKRIWKRLDLTVNACKPLCCCSLKLTQDIQQIDFNISKKSKHQSLKTQKTELVELNCVLQSQRLTMGETITPRINAQWKDRPICTSWGKFHMDPNMPEVPEWVHQDLGHWINSSSCTLHSLLPESSPSSHSRFY